MARQSTVISYDAFSLESSNQFKGLFAPKVKLIADNADAIINQVPHLLNAKGEKDYGDFADLIKQLETMKASKAHGFLTGRSEQAILDRVGKLLSEMERAGVPVPPEIPEAQLTGFYKNGAEGVKAFKAKGINVMRKSAQCSYEKTESTFEKVMPLIGQAVSWTFGIGTSILMTIWAINMAFSLPMVAVIAGGSLWALRMDKYSAVEKMTRLAQHIRRSWSGVYAEYTRFGVIKDWISFFMIAVTGTYIGINSFKMLRDGYKTLFTASQVPFVAVAWALATTWNMVLGASDGIGKWYKLSQTITTKPIAEDELETSVAAADEIHTVEADRVEPIISAAKADATSVDVITSSDVQDELSARNAGLKVA